MAFVGYRDHYDGPDRISSINFTEDSSAVVKFMSSIIAIGGGDTCEDIFGGLECVNSLDWCQCYITFSSSLSYSGRP